MNLQQAVQWALDNAGREQDNSLDHGKIVDLAVTQLDTGSYAERAVRQELARRQRSRQTPPDGQLCLPGLEPYAYEPDRLVADDDKRIIELRNANPHFTTAENQRRLRKAKRDLDRAVRDGMQNDLYIAWVMENLTGHKSMSDLTFDHWVKESGLWNPDPLPADDEPATDE